MQNSNSEHPAHDWLPWYLNGTLNIAERREIHNQLLIDDALREELVIWCETQRQAKGNEPAFNQTLGYQKLMERIAAFKKDEEKSKKKE